MSFISNTQNPRGSLTHRAPRCDQRTHHNPTVCVCVSFLRDPEPAGGAVQMSGAAVGLSHPADAGPAGVLPPQGRDPAGVLPQPGEAG